MKKTNIVTSVLDGILSRGIIAAAFMLAVLEAAFQGCHDHESIYGKIEEDYLDPCYEDHELDSGGSAIEKHIAWAIWILTREGYLERTDRGWYEITEKGRETLKVLPYHLEGWLEKALDQTGILSGKAFYDLHKHDDGTYGAAVEAGIVRLLIMKYGFAGN